MNIDGDGPDFCADRVQRARKPHRCCACKETIRPGDEFRLIAGKWDGNFHQFRQCSRCAAMYDAIEEHATDGVVITLNCGHTWEEVIGECPEEVQSLAFALPGEIKLRKDPRHG